MKLGVLQTAAALMAKMVAAIKANAKADVATLQETISGGGYRFRGKGRGTPPRNFHGKTHNLARDGKRERRRRMRQMFGETAPQRAGWPK